MPLGATPMPEPSCQHGYTTDDLERYFGAKQGEAHQLWDQLHGQTGAICEGKTCSKPGAPHGLTSYVGDVQEWVEGRPVSDW